MFLSRNKKNNVYPCKPQFYYPKVGFKGGQNYIGMFSRCFSISDLVSVPYITSQLDDLSGLSF